MITYVLLSVYAIITLCLYKRKIKPLVRRKIKICEHEGCNNMHYNKRFCSPECSSINSRKVSRPNRQELFNDISNMPMVAVGKKYGVSDNAVRKWARKYGLI